MHRVRRKILLYIDLGINTIFPWACTTHTNKYFENIKGVVFELFISMTESMNDSLNVESSKSQLDNQMTHVDNQIPHN